MKYINEFLRLNSASDILSKIGKTNAKEITEIMATWHRCREIINKNNLWDTKTVILDVGSGKIPRFSILSAHLTKFDIYAIDPELEIKDYRTERLNLIKSKVELVDLKYFIKNYSFIIITMIHSHAPIEPLTQLKNKVIIYLPCCYLYLPSNTKMEAYLDTHILSPKNIFYIIY